MHYKVIYTTKADNKEIEEIFFNIKEVESIVKQLQKGLTSIKGKLINGYSEVKTLKIIEYNYDYLNEKGFHIEEKIVSNNGEFIEIPEYCIKINPNFIPKEIDITNRIFDKMNIGNIGDEIIIYKGGNLSIYNEPFHLNKKYKYYELIDLILETYNKTGKKEFDYDFLKENYQDNKYKEINKNLLNKDYIRSGIKDKMQEIRDYFKMGKDIITIGNKITINY